MEVPIEKVIIQEAPAQPCQECERRRNEPAPEEHPLTVVEVLRKQLVEVPIEITIEKITEVPSPPKTQIVEKIVEIPVETIVYVDRIVEVPAKT